MQCTLVRYNSSTLCTYDLSSLPSLPLSTVRPTDRPRILYVLLDENPAHRLEIYPRDGSLPQVAIIDDEDDSKGGRCASCMRDACVYVFRKQEKLTYRGPKPIVAYAGEQSALRRRGRRGVVRLPTSGERKRPLPRNVFFAGDDECVRPPGAKGTWPGLPSVARCVCRPRPIMQSPPRSIDVEPSQQQSNKIRHSSSFSHHISKTTRDVISPHDFIPPPLLRPLAICKFVRNAFREIQSDPSFFLQRFCTYTIGLTLEHFSRASKDFVMPGGGLGLQQLNPYYRAVIITMVHLHAVHIYPHIDVG